MPWGDEQAVPAAPDVAPPAADPAADHLFDVVIIGAGIAALTAARTLLLASSSSSSSPTSSSSSSSPSPSTTSSSPYIGSILLVEANDYVGGRIRSTDTTADTADSDSETTFVPGHVVDLGAEIIHGSGTVLTDLIDEYRDEFQRKIGGPNEDLLEEIFIAAQGDGGPGDRPTRDGKFGVYYLAEEDKLLRFDTDDEDFLKMTESLSNLVAEEDLREDGSDDDGDGDGGGAAAAAADKAFGAAAPTQQSRRRRRSSAESLGDRLTATAAGAGGKGGATGATVVPRRMSGLLLAGYANTVGCSDLSQVSLSATISYERHWDENEVDGDVRLHSRIGMVGVVKAMRDELERDDRVTIMLNWEAELVDWGQQQQGQGQGEGQGQGQGEKNNIVSVTSTDGRTVRAKHVIVTAPPPVITTQRLKFDPPLPRHKMDAFRMMGMDRAIKVILQFQDRIWPELVQTVIAADMAMPEIWFREFRCCCSDDDDEEEGGRGEETRRTVYAAVCFLTSSAADKLVQAIEGRIDEWDHSPLERRRAEIAADIAKEQLSTIFTVPRHDVEAAYVSSVMFDWGTVPTILGGYSYPRVNIEPRHFLDMAQSLGGGMLHFAGEATNTGAACTVQAAMETGVRAAKEILERYAAGETCSDDTM